jgi:O-methyltransferase
MRIRELAKSAIYRTPLFTRWVAPRYRYYVTPGELAAMVGFMDATRASNGAVVEIGVARGFTSTFILEHLRTTGDTRELLLFDTFSGFTKGSVDVEVQRGKSASDFDLFRYGDEAQFARNLRALGYDNFRTFQGDASRFDWSSLGPIGAVLLDIDVYGPTLSVLNDIYPHLCPGGGIIVDDCYADTPYDGALQAYKEFVAEKGLPFEVIGEKGGLVRAVSAQQAPRLS